MAKTIFRVTVETLYYLVTLPLRVLAILEWFLYGLLYMIVFGGEGVKDYWTDTEKLEVRLTNELHFILERRRLRRICKNFEEEES